MKHGLENLINADFNKSIPSSLGIQSVITIDDFREIPFIYRWAIEYNIVPLIELLLHLSLVSRKVISKFT